MNVMNRRYDQTDRRKRIERLLRGGHGGGGGGGGIILQPRQTSRRRRQTMQKQKAKASKDAPGGQNHIRQLNITNVTGTSLVASNFAELMLARRPEGGAALPGAEKGRLPLNAQVSEVISRKATSKEDNILVNSPLEPIASTTRTDQPPAQPVAGGDAARWSADDPEPPILLNLENDSVKMCIELLSQMNPRMFGLNENLGVECVAERVDTVIECLFENNPKYIDEYEQFARDYRATKEREAREREERSKKEADEERSIPAEDPNADWAATLFSQQQTPSRDSGGGDDEDLGKFNFHFTPPVPEAEADRDRPKSDFAPFSFVRTSESSGGESTDEDARRLFTVPPVGPIRQQSRYFSEKGAEFRGGGTTELRPRGREEAEEFGRSEVPVDSSHREVFCGGTEIRPMGREEANYAARRDVPIRLQEAEFRRETSQQREEFRGLSNSSRNEAEFGRPEAPPMGGLARQEAKFRAVSGYEAEFRQPIGLNNNRRDAEFARQTAFYPIDSRGAEFRGRPNAELALADAGRHPPEEFRASSTTHFGRRGAEFRAVRREEFGAANPQISRQGEAEFGDVRYAQQAQFRQRYAYPADFDDASLSQMDFRRYGAEFRRLNSESSRGMALGREEAEFRPIDSRGAEFRRSYPILTSNSREEANFVRRAEFHPINSRGAEFRGPNPVLSSSSREELEFARQAEFRSVDPRGAEFRRSDPALGSSSRGGMTLGDGLDTAEFVRPAEFRVYDSRGAEFRPVDSRGTEFRRPNPVLSFSSRGLTPDREEDFIRRTEFRPIDSRGAAEFRNIDSSSNRHATEFSAFGSLEAEFGSSTGRSSRRGDSISHSQMNFVGVWPAQASSSTDLFAPVRSDFSLKRSANLPPENASKSSRRRL